MSANKIKNDCRKKTIALNLNDIAK
jgi:hypothetical protein